MTELRDPQPYEVLKAALDDAHKEFDTAVNNLMRNVNHKDGPMLLLIDIEAVFRAHAVVKACDDAFTREYAHMAEINDQLTAQRDEINRKFESFKRTLNQLNQEDATSASAKPSTKGRKRKQ